MSRIIIALLLIYGCTNENVVPTVSAQSNQDIIDFFSDTDTIKIGADGQSNACGRCTSTGGFISSTTNIEAWNNVNNWAPAQAGTVPFGADRGSFLLSFADTLQKITNKPIRIILTCEGGNPIENWLPPINTNFIQFENQVIASNIGKLDIYLFGQGEENRDASIYCNDSTCYRAKQDSLIQIISGKTYVQSDLIIIFMGLYDGGSYASRNDVILSRNLDYSDRIGAGDPTGLTSCDGVHFTGTSLAEMGDTRMLTTLQNITFTLAPKPTKTIISSMRIKK